MFLILIRLGLVVSLLLTAAPVRPVRASDQPPKLDAATLPRVCEATVPAVVRLDSGSIVRSGVIVSREGLILTMSNQQPKLKVDVHLADGRMVAGETLGMSEERGIGMVRIMAPGPWPHVEIQDRPMEAAGKVGLVVGYPRTGAGSFDAMPTARLAPITIASASGWAAADCPVEISEFGCGLFDVEGKLLGTFAGSVDLHPGTFALATALSKKDWAALEAGRCLDYERVIPLARLDGAKDAADKPGPATAAKDFPADTRARATRASVKILPDASPMSSFSGTLVDANGIVATCAHTNQLPGQRVKVRLTDGREAAGKVLGTNRVADVGLIQLEGPGPWPGVPIGDSSRVSEGQSLLIVGYPAITAQGIPERVEIVTTAVRPPFGYSPLTLFTPLDFEVFGGMSGGGLFDRDGRLIGIHIGGAGQRVEVVKAEWKDLLGEAEVAGDRGGPAPLRIANDVTQRVGAAVVSVEQDGRPVTLGTVVGGGGLVLTKASLVGSEVSCRLTDQRLVTGKVVRRWAGHDLALVKLAAAEGLSPVSWPKSDRLPVGTLVWTPRPGATPTTGIVGHAARPIGPEPAWAGEGLGASDRGPAVDGMSPPPAGLEIGDLVAAIEGRPTRSVDDVRKALGQLADSPVPGDPLRIEIARSGKKIPLVIPLPHKPQEFYQPDWVSSRRSGFDEVYTCDLPVGAAGSGSPVFTNDGEFVGIIIASSQSAMQAQMINSVDKASVPERTGLGGTYVVPGVAIRKLIGEWTERKK